MAYVQTGLQVPPAVRMRASAPRRVVAVAAAAGIAGGLLYLHLGMQPGGVPVWAIAAALYAVLVGASAALIFRYLPNLGPFVELTAISRLLLALAAVAIPDFAVLMTTTPLLNATMIVAGAFLLRGLARRAAGSDARGRRVTPA